MAHSKLAAPELSAFEVNGMTRAAFTLRGALAAGAVGAVGAVTPFVRRAFAQSGGGDGEILNFALILEQLEAEFYRRAARLPLSAEAKVLARSFGRHEQDHAETLAATLSKLGAEPRDKPRFSFPGRTDAAFLRLAQTLEDTGVAAYNGAAPQIKSRDIAARCPHHEPSTARSRWLRSPRPSSRSSRASSSDAGWETPRRDGRRMEAGLRRTDARMAMKLANLPGDRDRTSFKSS
jgi:hypothetical protein